MILIVAAAATLVLFSGFIGSDDIVYANQALLMAEGRWSASDNVGALRLGYSVPAALFVLLLGRGMVSLSMWPFVCALGEIALVYGIAKTIWGSRAAVLASIFLAFLPVHLSGTGQLGADLPLAFFITLSMVLFFIAERRGQSRWYLAAGLAIGFVYWIKEVVIIFGAVFALYAIVFRRWDNKWIWTALGAAIVIGANCLVFLYTAGDALHVYKVLSKAVQTSYIENVPGWIFTSPSYYFSLMLTDFWDTWIMPFFAVACLVLIGKQLIQVHSIDAGTAYVLVWAAGLVGIFSFTIISLHPLAFIGKQSNYLLIFTAPLCLLAADAARRLQGPALFALLFVYVAGGVCIAAAEKERIRLFTAGTRAALAFAREHPETPVYGMVNAARIAGTLAKIEGGADARPLIQPLSRITDNGKDTASDGSVYALIDPRTADMGRNPIRSPADAPKCWSKVTELRPVEDTEVWEIARISPANVDRLPKPLARWLQRHVIAHMRMQEPVSVFRVPATCLADFGKASR